jgi:hypothetical protein
MNNYDWIRENMNDLWKEYIFINNLNLVWLWLFYND